jgi:CheY-like chemotaxis protein
LARTILLADDSVTAQNMGRRILTDAGYEVITVNNGSAALKKIAEHKPDLIVLDVYMPGYGGLEVCNRIKETRETARIPVLLTVGKLEPFKPDEARRVRADAFIVKPFEASELLTALTKLEDKIVPQSQPQKPGRFARALATIEAAEMGERFGDAETGWKERLSIPPVAAKTQATEAHSAPDSPMRDLGRSENFKPAEPSQRFERPIPAGLPADITPEEIAAIAAAAATIGGKEEAASPAAVATPAQVESKTEPEYGAALSQVSAVVTSEISAAVASETPTAGAEAPAAEVPAATLASAPLASVVATEQTEAPAVEKPEVEAAAVVAPVPSEPVPEVAASRESTTVAAGSSAAEPPATAPGVADAQSTPEQVTADTDDKPWARDAEVLAAIASLVPSAEDLARNLEQDNAGAPQSYEAATVAAVASTMAASPVATGPRWIAEAAALSEDDTSINLELEMEKAYAAFAAAAAEAARVGVEAAEAPATASSGIAAVAIAEVPATAAVSIPAIAVEMPHSIAATSESKREAAYAAAANGFSTDVVTQVEAAAATPMPVNALSAVDDGEKLREAEMAAAWENWKQIRETIVGSQLTSQIANVAAAGLQASQTEAAKSSNVESKEAAREDAEEENGSDASSEPAAIASIVDSVLAELKPKLMEEIARKMNSEKEKKAKGKKNKK